MSSLGYAQYVPLPTQNATWSSLVWLGGLPSHVETAQTDGDTLIGGTVYTKIHQFGGWSGGDFLIREDSLKRVYVRKTTPLSPETLIYQFGLNVGDTITTEPCMAFGPETMWVSAVDTIQIQNGDFRRRMRMESAQSASWNAEFWIEGVGSSRGIMNAGAFVWDFDAALLCQHLDTIQEFAGDLFSTYGCTPIITGIEEETEMSLEVWPQPGAPGEVVVEVESPGPASASLIDLQGRVLQEFKLAGANQRLDSFRDDLAPGIYILRIAGRGFLHTERLIFQ